MARNQIRQSSLIQGVGPGALTVLQDGSTVMIPGIDAWYVTKDSPRVQRLPREVTIEDPLLQKNLGVQFFVIPPANGVSEEKHAHELETSLFPNWLICYSCNALIPNKDTVRGKCTRCATANKYSRKMVQTNFVIACEDGHLDEFPWLEWVHRGAANVCASPELTFKANGVVQLRSQMVLCSCGKRRDLSGTTGASEDGTTDLSQELEPGNDFLCVGSMPWLRLRQTKCGKHVRMVLRNSNNIYFASTVSSILVPSHSGRHSIASERLRSSNAKGTYLGMLLKNGYKYELIASAILTTESNHYDGISLDDLVGALQQEFPQREDSPQVDLSEENPFDRTPEWLALSTPKEDRDMVVRKVGSIPENSFGLENIHAVPLLKKTTALKGFTRLKPGNMSPAKGRQLLRRDPFISSANWLPAIQHTGEGIFISLEPKMLNAWVARPEVQNRVGIIEKNLLSNNRTFPEATLNSKFVLLHTLAHVLIQELVIECGYTSAALAERIYAEDEQGGILIYTASASADGTMGGLVEMATPDILIPILHKAIERASWCSNDPVCMELGHSGQGNSGSNLAACHSCCLLPETACEHFNQALDRALLVGDTTSRTSLNGFFEQI